MKSNQLKRFISILCSFFLILSCGGGGGGGLVAGGGIGGTGIISTGAITAFASVEVNGTKFDTSNAAIIINGVEIGIGDDFGAKSLGVELANSNQFASCQVKKVFKAVCLREPETDNDHNRVDAILQSIGQGPIIMKQVFADTAEYCMGQ